MNHRTVHFEHNKDFRYSWRRRNGILEIGISDYMEDAPPDILSDFIEFVDACSRGSKDPIPDSVSSYLSSDSFILSKRPVFISRSRNLARTDIGEHRNLFDSVQRLLDSGLLLESDVENSYFSWTRRDNRRRVGFCSRMFRVVGISAVLDSQDVPEWVLDYVVYHESLHLRQRYGCPAHHDSQFRSWEHAYPQWREAEKFLSSL